MMGWYNMDFADQLTVSESMSVVLSYIKPEYCWQWLPLMEIVDDFFYL